MLPKVVHEGSGRHKDREDTVRMRGAEIDQLSAGLTLCTTQASVGLVPNDQLEEASFTKHRAPAIS